MKSIINGKFRNKLITLILLLAFLSSINAFGIDSAWLKKCPEIIDLQPNMSQPSLINFTFTGTQQIFTRIDANTGKPFQVDSPLVGCYADFAGLNGATSNGYHVGSINRDQQGFYWINAAGVSWRLTLDSSGEFLLTGAGNPYQKYGNRFLIVDPLTGINYRNRGAFGMSADPTSDVYKAAWVGTQDFPLPQQENSYGFSFYTSVWPLFREHIKGMTSSAGVTWIYPRTDTLGSDKSCPWGLQSMEGGLAWSPDQFRFPTLLPKYKLNPVADCYGSDAPNTPFWTFAGGQLSEGKISTLLISNRILVPPDGFTFENESAGGMLGVATMSLPFSSLIPANETGTGEQSWMVFFNSNNFKGPVSIYPAQLFSWFGKGDSLRSQLTFDKGRAFLTGAAFEWGGMPFIEYRSKSGEIFSKIPAMQLPSDSYGETVVMSDFKAYSKAGFYNSFGASLAGKEPIPTSFPQYSESAISMKVADLPLYQSGKQINPFAGGKLVALEEGKAFGFKWSESEKVISLPTIFKQVGDKRIAADIQTVPSELSDAKFESTNDGSFSYLTPSWWQNENSQPIYKTTLLDGSTITYSWVKFIDQPGVKALKLSSEELSKLQEFVTKFHMSWAKDPEFMNSPTRGQLATLDKSLQVTPPKGMEFGYVPLVLSQTGKSKSIETSDLLLSPDSAFKKQLATDTQLREIVARAKAEADSKAAAELKAKQEAEAKAAAELKAKQEADAKAAALAAAKKKMTITCIKGKVTKKVTGLNPKCPTGYKKK